MILSREKYLTTEEFKRLIYQARVRSHKNAVRDHAILLLGGRLGFRAKDVIALRHGDCFLGVSPPFLRVEAPSPRFATPKKDVEVSSSVARPLLTFIRSLPREDRKPWKRVFAMTVRQVERVFKRYAKLARLDLRYSFFALRHYYGLCVYKKTENMYLTKTLMRHISDEATKVYIRTVEAMRLRDMEQEMDR